MQLHNQEVKRALERKLVDEAITNLFLIKQQRKSTIKDGLLTDYRNRKERER